MTNFFVTWNLSKPYFVSIWNGSILLFHGFAMFWFMQINLYRSSHQRCSINKGVLNNFAKFWGKQLSQRLFFNKVAGLSLQCYYPFKRQSHKIVKHTQTILRQQPTNCLSVFEHFVNLALKGLKKRLWHKSFPLNFEKFLRTPILQNTSRQLLLPILEGQRYTSQLIYSAWVNFQHFQVITWETNIKSLEYISAISLLWNLNSTW